MTDDRPPSPPERFDLTRADDPRDIVHRAVASLAQGEGVLLSIGGLSGLAAGALHPDSVRLLGNTDLAETPGSTTVLLRGGEEVADWVPGLSPLGQRLARRAWPGPVTFAFPVPRGASLFSKLPHEVRSYLLRGESVAMQAPRHPFLRDVLKLVPGPVIFRSMTDDAAEADVLGLESGVRLLIESRSGLPTDEVTVVEVGTDSWSIVRPGSTDERALNRMAGTILLFVCTGNTCRSPMAEAICKVLLAERLGCDVGGLESRGFSVISAGIAASSGMSAAAYAIDVIKARGGSLQDHASQKLTLELVRQADAILTMTGDHLEALLEHVPEVAPRTRLLHPQGLDVADPVGADRETYQRAAAAIETYVSFFLDTLNL